MKTNNIFKRFLTAADNGNFYKSPFRVLYILIGIAFLALIIFMNYNAIITHNAFNVRDNARIRFEASRSKFRPIQRDFTAISDNYEQLSTEKENLTNRFSELENNMEYYLYNSEYYAQEINEGRKELSQIRQTLKENRKKLPEAEAEYNKMLPTYEKAKNEMKSHEGNYMRTCEDYEYTAPEGAYHYTENKFQAFTALVLFIITTLATGLLILLFFIHRSKKLKTKINDDNEFAAIPIMSFTIKTLGEASGIYIASFGMITVIISLVCQVSFGSYGLGMIYFENLISINDNPLWALLYLAMILISAFLLMFLTRLLAEAIQSVVTIAESTRKLLSLQNGLNVECNIDDSPAEVNDVTEPAQLTDESKSEKIS